MISKDEVKHIAKLARLGLTSNEIKKFQKELSLIFDYIEKLKEVNISNVELYSDLGELRNVMREDTERKDPKGQSSKLLDLAPEKKGAYLKTKQIL